MLFLSALHAAVPIDTTSAGNEIAFDLNSLEMRPLPEIAGLNFGNTILSLQADTATYDSRSRKVRITGRVIIKQEQEGISSCTIALGSLKS